LTVAPAPHASRRRSRTRRQPVGEIARDFAAHRSRDHNSTGRGRDLG